MQPQHSSTTRSVRLLAFPVLALAIVATVVDAQVPPDQAAEMLLNAAKKAYNEQNYPFAAQKFGEYIQKFGGHPNAASVRYGLALCYIDGPERNFEKAIDTLAPVLGNTNFPEYPYAVYYAGLAQRGVGINDLTLAATKQGPEQQQIRARAEGRFKEALKQFTLASTTFGGKLPKELPPKGPPKELSWAARARCDQVEMELRLNKFKEAQAAAEPFTKDPLLSKSEYRLLGLYYHGFASFMLQDYLVAGRSLNQLAPFSDPTNGLHAGYLMGRVYQISEENDKAVAMYERVLAEYEKQKKDAVEALKRPDLLKNNPTERVRLEGLTRNPPPDAVSGAVFYSACLLYEAGKFGEALARFQAFAKDYPASPLQPEAALRVGYCLVQLKQFPEAVTALNPLVDRNPRLADQILFWLGKAQVGLALAVDPANQPARDNAFRTALTTLRNAADRSNQLAGTEPDAKMRRFEILLELADAQQHAKLYKEAVTGYEQLVPEKMLAPRVEEISGGGFNPARSRNLDLAGSRSTRKRLR